MPANRTSRSPLTPPTRPPRPAGSPIPANRTSRSPLTPPTRPPRPAGVPIPANRTSRSPLTPPTRPLRPAGVPIPANPFRRSPLSLHHPRTAGCRVPASASRARPALTLQRAYWGDRAASSRKLLVDRQDQPIAHLQLGPTVGLAQGVHHRPRVSIRRDLGRDRPQGVPGLDHVLPAGHEAPRGGIERFWGR